MTITRRAAIVSLLSERLAAGAVVAAAIPVMTYILTDRVESMIRSIPNRLL